MDRLDKLAVQLQIHDGDEEKKIEMKQQRAEKPLPPTRGSP